jgi:pimeloyl-ACP methyl ester carboxylesterase
VLFGLPTLLAVLGLTAPRLLANDSTVTFLDVPRGRLWYEATGTGPAMVLLHDGLLPSETWDAQVQPFARFFRVVRYDRRRYGRSTTETDDFSQVADLRALLDHLKIGRATLMGCSSGGGLALDFALAEEDRVETLVLVGPVVSGFDYSGHFSERGARNMAPFYMSKDEDAAVENWAHDRYLTDARNEAARRQLGDLLRRFPFSAAGGDPGGRPEAKALGRLGEIRVPVLLITGESDIPDVHAHIGAIASRLPWPERQVVPQAGHLPHLEKPADFNQRVLDFLAPPPYVRDVLADLRRGPPDLQAFAYDTSAALDLQETSVEKRGPVLVRDLSYASPRGGRVPAFLVAPEDARSRPALLFLHHGQGNRQTFLDEAVELAGLGFVSLLIDAPGYRGEPEGPHFEAASARAEIEQTVIDVRRGLDLLAARPEVDGARLGYVGYSLGATMGARLLGVEPRLRASVMVAGFAALTLDLSRGDRRAAVAVRALLPPERRSAYLEALAPLDGVRYLERRAKVPLLVQLARGDAFISRLDGALFALAAGEPVATSVYDGGHFELGQGPARDERRAFLLRSLADATSPPDR